MTHTNEDLLTALGRAAKDYTPEMHTPTDAETEYGVGTEPVVCLTLSEGVTALCRVVYQGETPGIQYDVLRLRDPDSEYPFDRVGDTSWARHNEELLPIVALLKDIEAARKKLATRKD